MKLFKHLSIAGFLFSSLIASIGFAQSPYPPLSGASPAPYQTQVPPQMGYFPPPRPALPYSNPVTPQRQARPFQQAPQLQQQQKRIPQKPFKTFSGYLGIVLDLVPASVAAQLPKGSAQGVLIKSFAPNSPAATSDLKPFDVMIAYDGVKLHHPEQFIKLVRDDKPARVVKIKVARQGKILDIPVTIGSQKTPNPKEFNGLVIKKIGEDKYQATIRFIGSNGNKQIRSYQGDRQEIFDEVMQAQDLPQAERNQLLFATRPREGKSNNNGFGKFFPFGGGNNNGSKWMNPGKFFNW